MKKYIKFIAFVVMLACLMSMNIISAFAANGNFYNLDTYTINNTRGYCESNFVFNVNTNCILRGEFKVVEQRYGALIITVYGDDYNGEDHGFYDEDSANTDEYGSTLVLSYTLSSSELYSNGIDNGSVGDIMHTIPGEVLCTYRGIWNSLTNGWSQAVLIQSRGLN